MRTLYNCFDNQRSICTINKTKIKIVVLIMLSLVFISICFVLPVNAIIKDVDSCKYIDKDSLEGTFVIKPYNKQDFCIDISGGRVSTTDGNAPKLIVFQSGDIPQANHRFEFKYLTTMDKYDVFYITSSSDRNGRFDVKSGSYTNGNIVWFYGECPGISSLDNDAQRWSVKTFDNGLTYQIFSSDHPEFHLSYNSETNECVITNDDEDQNGFWLIEPVCGTYGINTNSYNMGTSSSISFSNNNKVNRIISPNGSTGVVSSVFNVGVYGENTYKTKYYDTLAFSVKYDSKFYIHTNFVYSSKVYSWGPGTVVGRLSCSDGKTRNWTVKDTGEVIVQVSDDNINWKNYKTYKYSSAKNNDIIELDGLNDDLLRNGVYIRVIYSFYLKSDTWREYEWYEILSFLGVGGHDVYNTRHIVEASDSFYVCVDGFGDSSIGALTFKNLTQSDTGYINAEGYSEYLSFGETLVDGSVTTSGFYISSPYTAYCVQIKKNDGEYSQVVLNKQDDINYVSEEYTEEGKYDIEITSKFGLVRNLTIYVLKNPLETYFGTAFSKSLLEESFIRGQRILTDNENLNSLGVNLFSKIDVPVYSIGCRFHINGNVNLCNIQGVISCESEDGVEEIIVNTENCDYEEYLFIPGRYSAELKTTGEYGDVVTFRFNWWVVDIKVGPTVNEQLIKNKTQELYDLIPVYYGVKVEGNRYTYIEDNYLVEKTSVMYYAFASYNSALDFALSVEKEFAIKEANGQYTYQHANNPQMVFKNDYELFKEMYKNAKANVKQRYFSPNDVTTMRVFTLYDKDGNKRTYDNGDEIIAYCVAENTNYCVVTTNKVELAALTARQPFINNYQFIRDEYGLDSNVVTIRDENGNSYGINYDEPVEQQMIKQNAMSGKYTVVETNIYGDTNEYDVFYIAKNSTNDSNLKLSVNGRIINITNEENGEKINCNKFRLISCTNPNDNHGLLLVEVNKSSNYGERTTFSYDISKLDGIEFDQKGTYSIKVEDRLGNYFEIEIKIA